MNDAVTSMNGLGLLFTLAMVVLLLFLPRRLAVLPLIMTGCYITLGQGVAVGPLNFTVMRILIFVGCIRVIIRKEVSGFAINKIDKILLAYALSSAIVYILLRKNNDAVINSLGFFYNAVGFYFLFRSLIYDQKQYQLIFMLLAVVILPLAVSMIVEKTTGRNLFSIFGGVPEFTMIRNDKMRCQGAFSHPILAGTFAASSLAFFLPLWRGGAVPRAAALTGMVSATAITITTASSGPLMVFAAVLVGALMWRYRAYMRTVRWILLLTLIALHIVMKAPVWALIGKVSEIIGGGGWHRVMVIDAAIEHFGEWWLLGTDYTRHWLPTGVSWSENHTDITNYFIGIGIRGGLVSVVLFIWLLVSCFKTVGVTVKEIDPGNLRQKFAIWCLGVSLFAHTTAFFSVSYFDQIIIFWYLLLAMIGSLPTNLAKKNMPAASTLCMRPARSWF